MKTNRHTDPDYFKKYYQENKEHIKKRCIERYNNNNKDTIRATAVKYRKSDSYKVSKAKSNRIIQDARKLSSAKSELEGKLGKAYTPEEDETILLYKNKMTYRKLAELLSRSMKGVEYRYNLLRKREK